MLYLSNASFLEQLIPYAFNHLMTPCFILEIVGSELKNEKTIRQTRSRRQIQLFLQQHHHQINAPPCRLDRCQGPRGEKHRHILGGHALDA